MDEEWVDKTSRRVASNTEKIEADLKSYKHNLIKESIRVDSPFFSLSLSCKKTHLT